MQFASNLQPMRIEEDRGDNNKDSDWLIEQSIERQVAGGVSHCATAIARNKNVARQVAALGNMLHRAIAEKRAP